MQTAEVSQSIARDIAGVNSMISDLRQGGEQVQLSAAQLCRLAEQLSDDRSGKSTCGEEMRG